MKRNLILVLAGLHTLAPLRSSESRLTLNRTTDSLDAQASCNVETHRVLWQTAVSLEGPWRSVDTATVTNRRAGFSWKPTASLGFLRAVPKPTPGFLERLTRIRAQVRESWPKASLLEAHLLVSDWTDAYPDSVAVRAIFTIDGGTVTAVENAPGEDVALSISDRPWLGSQALGWPIAMELDIAESLLREAGYGPAYRSLTLRQPVYPGMVEPYWIFGTRSGFVFVGSRTGTVKPGN